ncbi:MAG: AAA family ATPase [Gammaproteobacteria bacterium]|nr:AAA family ATPase [Gammaproteobacteria bacterium]MYB38340.1 AAA family ATPase [Gammaproteobacteria bacterium]
MDGRYRLRVRNFGPIRDAEVEIRPLTVFVGPSNTGKSYLAGLLYALHRALGPAGGGDPLGLLLRRFSRREELDEELQRDVALWLDTTVERRVRLPATLAARVYEDLNQSSLGATLAQEVARCFGVENTAALVRHSSRPLTASLDVVVAQAKDEARLRAALNPNAKSPSVDVDVGAHRFSLRELQQLREEDDLPSEGLFAGLTSAAARVIDGVTHNVFHTAFRPLRDSAYFLPADRTGVMHSHHVIVSALLQRASLAGIRRFDGVPMLSGVMADFLDVLVSHVSQLNRWPGRSEGTPELAEGIEQRVLNGRVQVNAGEVGYPAFSYRPSGWRQDLPLMRASSMVSELAPVVLYLRHVVRKGDLLIIEEPESHLHPAKQTTFARELAAIVNAGVRVVITTHSEWFLEQIGNLVRAAELPVGKRESTNAALKAEDVGAWLFQDTDGEGSTVSEIKVDPDTGLFPTDYGPVSDALYNEHAAIFNALEGDSDE